MSNPKINLLGFDRAQLANFFVERGEPAYRATQLLKWIHSEGIADFSDMTNISKVLKAKLSEECELTFLEKVSEQISSDGTRKWLFGLPEGGAIETVYIPEVGRATLCISSQVGCILNCRFCYTAQQGFQRNLKTSEIIGQLWAAHRLLKEAGLFCKDGRTITNVVMMGMGEPLLNLENVLPALNIMRDEFGYSLSKYRVTVSTSGVVPGIDELAKVSDVALALSLHAPNDVLRSQIVPLNKKYPLKTVLASCTAYIQKEGKRHITMEYVMLKGVNDKPEHAKQLISLLHRVPCKINLIPFNPFKGADYVCSDFDVITHFCRQLQNAGFITTIRKTRGQDIDAACGQLAGNVKDKTQRSAKAAAKIQTDIVVNG
jgi:23S rRNA (adenine2503-C2)-methyltransferase